MWNIRPLTAEEIAEYEEEEEEEDDFSLILGPTIDLVGENDLLTDLGKEKIEWLLWRGENGEFAKDYVRFENKPRVRKALLEDFLVERGVAFDGLFTGKEMQMALQLKG